VSKARLVITSVVLEGRSMREAARAYGVSHSWISRLVARYREEGERAFEPRSRRPRDSPKAIAPEVVERILQLRHELTEGGLDAGPDTIAWHLAHRHRQRVSPATVSRYLTRHGLVVPDPAKRPKSSYRSFQAALPNERWQADFTHYLLTRPDGRPGRDTEILTWLDDCSRYALKVTGHTSVTGPLVVASFRQAVAEHGLPSSTLTDNGMVFTTRLSGGKGGRNAFEAELSRLHVRQVNSQVNHPTTCGKVERFQQTMKNWLRAQPQQPTSLGQLQALLDTFVRLYNEQRPHRSLPHRATPAAVYRNLPKAAPLAIFNPDPHRRLRHDILDAQGKVTLRVEGRLRHIGVGRTHARTPVFLLVQDLDVRVIDAASGELCAPSPSTSHATTNPPDARQGSPDELRTPNVGSR
jgi:transposase InsO family protein